MRRLPSASEIKTCINGIICRGKEVVTTVGTTSFYYITIIGLVYSWYILCPDFAAWMLL
mgnify:CR=1 FL=1